jgi:hypothetical protein
MRIKFQSGQTLVYAAIGFTVIAVIAIYFFSQQANDNAATFSDALQENYNIQGMEITLADVASKGYTEGAVVKYNQWSYHCRDGRSDMEFPSMGASLPSFYGISCPTDAVGTEHYGRFGSN